jgi:hypothetical protein
MPLAYHTTTVPPPDTYRRIEARATSVTRNSAGTSTSRYADRSASGWAKSQVTPAS